MAELTGKTYGLDPAPGHVAAVSVLTWGPPVASVEDACDGSMLCRCKQCAVERADRIRRGVRGDASDPFRRAA